jgi:hypothetical protein
MIPAALVDGWIVASGHVPTVAALGQELGKTA